MSYFKKTAVLVALLMPLAGCKQDLPRQLDKDAAFGTVTGLKTIDNEKQLLYTQGEDPYKKVWGTAASYVVMVDGKEYKVHWDQSDKFKALKEGDKVNLHPTEYIACVGEADLKPTCVRLMRIYKSERRVNPIQGK
jgi:hypothetical protein